MEKYQEKDAVLYSNSVWGRCYNQASPKGRGVDSITSVTWDKIQTMKFQGPEYVSGLHLCCLQISGKSGLDLQGIEPLTSWS